MTTPESKVKAKVSKLLQETEGVYYFMPVQGGYGASTLDYLGSHRGRFFAIETKAPGKLPTGRQDTIIDNIMRAGGKVFVISGDTGPLERWLAEV